MNVKKVQQLISRLERLIDTPTEVGRFNMGVFGSEYRSTGKTGAEEPICETSACLAGETVLEFKTGQIRKYGGIEIPLAPPNQGYNETILIQATKDLELTPAQVDRLFFFKNWWNCVTKEMVLTGWPNYFADKYKEANTQQGALLVTIRRVEFFLKTKGTDRGADKLV